MTASEKIYTGLCTLFATLIIIGNLTYQKITTIELYFYSLDLSVGALLYPLTFLITALIVEFYGKEKAKFCIRYAMFLNILTVMIIGLMDHLPTASWSKINTQTFHQVFGFYGIAFVGSILACYISQLLDVQLNLFIRQLTQGKYLWLRSNGSTCISLFVDTSIVISFLTLFGIFPIQKMWPLIMNSYIWKLFFTLCSTPLFYLSVSSIKNYKEQSKIKLNEISEI